MLSVRPRLGCLVAFAVAMLAGDALAGEFQIEPTRIDLARRGATSELTISNRGRATARVEVRAYRWSQDDHGAMQLAPTTDVVVYPSLFAIDAGAKRSIRIAVTASPGATEQSYRVFIEELPPSRAKVADGKPATIAVLARIGVPIFLAPTKPTVSGTIAGTVRDGTLHLTLENHGTVHVKVASIRVTASDRAGRSVLDKTQASWYLLAGDVRAHDLELDPQTCRSIDRLVLLATTDRGTWSGTVAMPREGCKRVP